MSKAVITTEHRDWVNSVARRPAGGTTRSARPVPESQSRTTTNAYGQAYFTLNQNVPKQLATALASDPPAMLSVADWDAIRTEANKAAAPNKRKEVFTKKTEILKGLDFMDSIGKLWEDCQINIAHWRRVEKRLLQAKKEGKGCDLRDLDPPNTDYTGGAKVDEGLQHAQKNLQLLLDDSAKGFLGEPLKWIKEAQDACLSILDAPANNPEWARVGRALARIEEIDAEFLAGRLNDANAREKAVEKAAALFALLEEIFAWIDRRTQHKLPPTAEAVALGDVLQRVHENLIKDVLEHNWDLPLPDADKLSQD
jgi:hypothetical protein